MTASTRSNAVPLRRRSRALAIVGFATLLASACSSGDGPLPPVTTSVGGSGGSSGGNVDAGTGGSSGDGGSSSGGSAGSGGGMDPDGGAGTGGTGGSGVGGSGTTGGAGGSGPTGGAGATGGSGATGGAGGSGATGGSGGSGATGGAGGSAGDGGAEVNYRCKPTRTFGTDLGRLDSISNEHLGRLGSISPDELTVAWTSGSGDIYVAERLAFKDPFGTPVKVNTVALATDRVAMAPTGRTVLAVRADRAAFVGFEKSSATGEWATSGGLEFTQVRVAFEGGALASDPVLSGDKRSFFFVMTPPNKPSIVYESVWDSVQRSWGLPAILSYTELQPTAAGKRRRPTGTSSDDLTLFFFDEATNIERAAWRTAPGAPFTLFKDLGAFAEAVTGLRCDTLYYQGENPQGLGVFMRE